jgi:hypothetical protein
MRSCWMHWDIKTKDEHTMTELEKYIKTYFGLNYLNRNVKRVWRKEKRKGVSRNFWGENEIAFKILNFPVGGHCL